MVWVKKNIKKSLNSYRYTYNIKKNEQKKSTRNFKYYTFLI